MEVYLVGSRRTMLRLLSLVLVATLLSQVVIYGFSAAPTVTTRSPCGAWTPTSIRQQQQQQQQQSVVALWKVPRGGGRKALQATASSSSSLTTGWANVAASIWGVGGVLYILTKAIKRVIPIAMEPFTAGAIPLHTWEFGAYIVTCLWFAYVEGFKGFQQKFSPLVVKRSFTLSPGQNGTKWYHFIFAPMYSMALFHATRKRKIVSWSVTTGVAIIVAAVKRLPYPYRNIVDAGVVAGLTWGSISILILYLKAWITGKSPDIDAALPENVVEKTKK